MDGGRRAERLQAGDGLRAAVASQAAGIPTAAYASRTTPWSSSIWPATRSQATRPCDSPSRANSTKRSAAPFASRAQASPSQAVDGNLIRPHGCYHPYQPCAVLDVSRRTATAGHETARPLFGSGSPATAHPAKQWPLVSTDAGVAGPPPALVCLDRGPTRG